MFEFVRILYILRFPPELKLFYPIEIEWSCKVYLNTYCLPIGSFIYFYHSFILRGVPSSTSPSIISSVQA